MLRKVVDEESILGFDWGFKLAEYFPQKGKNSPRFFKQVLRKLITSAINYETLFGLGKAQ
jgi:hypothetical protein